MGPLYILVLTILISTAFRGTVLIRRKTLIRGSAYFNVDTQRCSAYLDAYVFINNPYWQSCGIIIFLCKYYVVISDTLVGFFLDVLIFLLAGILSELHEKTRGKDWVTEKST